MFSKIKAFIHKFTVALTIQACNPAWQVGHFLAGMGIPALAYVAYPKWYVLLGTAGGLGIVYVPVKEWVYDTHAEHATVMGGLDDAMHYWAGSALTLLVYGVGRLLHG